MNKNVLRRYGKNKKRTSPVAPETEPNTPSPISATPLAIPARSVPVVHWKKQKGKRAIFWICTGHDYIEEARLSARSAGWHMPDLRRVLFTPDAGVEKGTEFEEVLPLPERIHPGQWFLESTRYLAMVLPHLPEYLVWATGDTYCCQPFGWIFGILKESDWASTYTPGGSTGKTAIPVSKKFPEPSICVSGLHNAPRLQDFAKSWYEHYLENKDLYNSDQPALRAALWMHKDDIKFCALPGEWMAILAIPNDAKGKVCWLHGRLGTRFTYQDPELMEKYAREVNSIDGLRIWRPGKCESR